VLEIVEELQGWRHHRVDSQHHLARAPAHHPPVGAIDFGYPTPFAYFAAPGFAFMNYIHDSLLQ